MDTSRDNAPRLLIVEPDNKVRSAVLRYAVKGWPGASVQSTSGTLVEILADPERLKSFDVLLVGCDFSTNGTADNPTLHALRAIAADPNRPAVILLTAKGSEYTAVQAMRAGAFDYLPKALLGREQIVAAVQRALLERQAPVPSERQTAGSVRLFGYDLRRCLSTNGSTSVHAAFSAERGKEVVLKVLHRGRGALARDAGFDRFMAEFKLLHDIDDRAVAEIYDFRVTNQHCYIAMEYFPLGHLGSLLEQRLPLTEGLHYAQEIARALSIVHAAGVVHRDLKPGNIMLREDDTVALIDFGISQGAATALPTAGAEIAGTPYYISPEQARGEPTDERTDLYALGVILYQLLTGQKPYTGASADAILEQHMSAPVPMLGADLAAYQPLLNQLLAKDAALRLRSAREALEQLSAGLAAHAAEAVPLPAAAS